MTRITCTQPSLSIPHLGVQFVDDVDRKQFVEAEKAVWDKYATTPELKDLVKRIVDTK